MPVPYTFGTATTSIPLSNLDANFNTPVTIGNATVGLGNTVTTVGNLTLTNATISSGNVTVTTGIFGAGSNTAPSITTTGDTNTGIFFPAADTIAFTEGGVESMRIDASGQVGIGTSSPSEKLTVVGNAVIGSGANGTAPALSVNGGTDGANGPQIFGKGNGSNEWLISSLRSLTGGGALGMAHYVYGANPMVFWTNNAERMRITSAGDVGIGTSSPASLLSVNGVGTFGSLTSKIKIGLNGDSLSSDGDFYIQTSTANFLSLRTNGTEAMRIISTGNVGIGTSSPGQVLEVSKSQDTETQVRVVNANTGSSARSGFVLGNNSNAGAASLLLNSSNNTGLGGANSLNVYMGLSAPIAFFTNAAERMRIDSSGNLLVNATSTLNTEKLSVITADTVAGLFSNTSATGYYTVEIRNTATTGDRRLIRFLAGSGPSDVGAIFFNGSATVYATSSDYRLKENIAPITGALDKVSQLKPVTYTWKETGIKGEGFIAHEFQYAFPDAVSGKKDGIDANGNPEYQGMDVSFAVATLTAAIQEQQALIENLTTRLNALEGK